MLFDTHAHVLSADVARYPYSALRGGSKIPVSPLVFPIEELVKAMDQSGVAHACIVQRATIYGYDNSYALDAAAAYPGRFVPVVVLDAQDPASPAILRGMAGHCRLGGLRMVAPQLTEHDTAWLDSDEALGLWRTASDLALPVTVILYRRNNEAGRAALLGIARQFRDIPILIDHVGVPHASTPETRWAVSQGLDYVIPHPPDFGIEESVAQFGELGHVHFKVTDINFDRLKDGGFDISAFVKVLAGRFGAQRMVWGSDAGQSLAPYDEMIGLVRASAGLLNAQERADFLGGTAIRVYGKALG